MGFSIVVWRRFSVSNVIPYIFIVFIYSLMILGKDDLARGWGILINTTVLFLLFYRACIMQHLLNSKQCFFCKAEINSTRDIEPANNWYKYFKYIVRNNPMCGEKFKRRALLRFNTLNICISIILNLFSFIEDFDAFLLLNTVVRLIFLCIRHGWNFKIKYCNVFFLARAT